MTADDARAMGAEVVIRPATDADRPEVLELLGASLGWVPDADAAAYFRWKHQENPAGASPAWVATAPDDGRILGFRTMVRWRFERPGGEVVRAVRAVDTATHPDAAGRGIFRRLTLHALDELAAEGVAFVFNTPNDKSRPGYLSMGWVDLGRLRASVALAGPRALVTMVRSRQPADRWSEPCEGGRPALDVLAGPAIDGLLAAQPPAAALRTLRTPDHLCWRYGFAPLRYRAVQLGADAAEGIAVFRLRRRGAAREAALCELLAPGAEPRATRALARAVARASGADHVIRLGGPIADRAGFVRLPGQGPRLTWRAVTDGAAPDGTGAFDLQLGDIELL